MILRALRGLLLRVQRRPAAQREGEALIYLDALTGLPRVRTSSADVAMTGGGGGGGAPTTAQYITAATDGTLSAERVATNTATVTWDFGTAGQAKASVPAASTSAAGVVELATSDETTAGLAVQASDTRLVRDQSWGLCRPVTDILADSSSGHYQRHPLVPSVIRLCAPTTWADIADAKTSPPTTWSLANSAVAYSAAAASGALTLTHVTTSSTGLYNGTATAPYFYRSFTRVPGASVAWVFRLQAVIDDNGGRGAVGIMGPAGTLIAQFDLLNSSGTRYLRYILNGTTFSTIISRSAAECATGVWCMIGLDRGYGLVMAYNTSSSSTEPTTGWTEAYRIASTLAASNVTLIEYIAAVRESGGSNRPSVTVPSFRCASEDALGYLTARHIPLGTTGYPTTGDTVRVLTHDFGAPRLPDVATVRTMLEDAVNRIGADAATWSAGVTGSDADTIPDAPTTMQALASVDLKQGGSDTAASGSGYRYWSIYMRAASSGGTQPGSMDTALIRLTAA